MVGSRLPHVRSSSDRAVAAAIHLPLDKVAEAQSHAANGCRHATAPVIAAQAEHARRKRAAGVEPSRRTLGPLLDGETRLRTAEDVLAVIEAQIEAVLADDELGTAERARTAATLCGIALRAIEQADLAARVEALERALEARCAK